MKTGEESESFALSADRSPFVLPRALRQSDSFQSQGQSESNCSIAERTHARGAAVQGFGFKLLNNCETNPSRVKRLRMDTRSHDLKFTKRTQFSRLGNLETVTKTEFYDVSTKRTHRFAQFDVSSSKSRLCENYETNPPCRESQISGFQISNCPGEGGHDGAAALLPNEAICSDRQSRVQCAAKSAVQRYPHTFVKNLPNEPIYDSCPRCAFVVHPSNFAKRTQPETSNPKLGTAFENYQTNPFNRTPTSRPDKSGIKAHGRAFF